jgi:cyclic pyranopterin phosphate synthase
MPKDIFGKGYPFLKPSALLKYEEIGTLVEVFAELGVRKIRLTGGEPLLRKDLEQLVQILAGISGIDDIAITTNASLLTVNRASTLKKAGIRRINISLDALTPEIYQKINQIHYPMQDILDGVGHALESGIEAVKVNMVVQKGVNENDILPMVEYFRGTGAILRFIEFMDVGNHNQWNMDKVFGAREIVDLINSAYPLQPIGANYESEVAKRWRFTDGGGEIGVISSITQPFCGNCSRARLSARGELFTCLFATSGHNLKQLLADGVSRDQLRDKISSIWSGREDQYSMQRDRNSKGLPTDPRSQKVEMSYIGG